MGCIYNAARLTLNDILRHRVRVMLDRRAAKAVCRAAVKAEDIVLSGRTMVMLSRFYSYLSDVSRGLEHKIEKKIKK